LANVPIYGTKAAGRGLWKRIRTCLLELECQEVFGLPALYVLIVNGEPEMLLCTHVDDLIMAYTELVAAAVQKMRDILTFGAEEEFEFRWCGREFKQSRISFEVEVTCSATSQKLELVKLPGDKYFLKQSDPKCEESLVDDHSEAFGSGVGSLSWIARSCRPDQSHKVISMQSVLNKATYGDLSRMNATMQLVKDTHDMGFVFKYVDWKHACFVSITDAGHASEYEYLSETEELEPFRSPNGRLLCLADISAFNGADEFDFNLLAHCANILKRVCRSTVQAETYTIQLGVEHGDVMRAAFADMYGKLDKKHWEDSAASFVPMLWLTDCQSAAGALNNPILPKVADKRLGIELASMRQSLWRSKHGGRIDPRLVDQQPEDITDRCKWTDTSVMIADCLTKDMDGSKLMYALKHCRLNITQPPEAKETKRIKAEQRRKAKDDKAGADDVDIEKDMT
jgi:hypothetical protein